MTYVGGGSGEILRQKTFEFRVAEMAFSAFWDHFWVKSKEYKSLFFCSVSIIFKKILLIIGPLIKRGSLPIIIVYCIVLILWGLLVIVWGLDGPPRLMDPCTAHRLHTYSAATARCGNNTTVMSSERRELVDFSSDYNTIVSAELERLRGHKTSLKHQIRLPICPWLLL